ncbi:MAG: transposase [Acidimicrobiales bacterium]
MREALPSQADVFHRAHATVEVAITDLKEGAGTEHVPSGNFSADAAWLVCANLAHNLIRWSAILDEITPKDHLTVARTVRTRFLSIPARLARPGGRPALRAPLEWPWAKAFERALELLRALPPVPK